MQKDEYVLPNPISLARKTLQINAMTTFWVTSRTSYVIITAMGEQIEAFLGRSSDATNGFNVYYDREGGLNTPNHDVYEEARGVKFRGKSRAELALSQGQQQRRHTNIPATFEQKCHLTDGIQYPYHPSDDNIWSRYPISFRGCFTCGE